VCILGCASPRTGPTPDPLTRVITIPGGNGHGCLDHSGPGRSIAVAEWIWSVGEHTTETHREKTMHHRMMNLPVAGTLGVAALLAGPLARLPIDLGAGPTPKRRSVLAPLAV